MISITSAHSRRRQRAPIVRLMQEDSLIQALPDWVAFVRRDGVVQRQLGGRALSLTGQADVEGRSLRDLWSPEIGASLLLLVQRTLKDRSPCETQFSFAGQRYQVRVQAHGRERALCVIRGLSADPESERRDGVREAGRGAMERRAFVERLKQQVSDATLRENQLAILMIHIDGLDAVGRLFDFALVDQVHTALLSRLPSPASGAAAASWSVGRLGDNVLAAVVERYGDREQLREIAAQFQQSLVQPVVLGSATFSLTPSIGIAVLGEDATRARALLEHAQSAMLEARRNERQGISFYSDTLRIRSLARLDVERELREAIADDQLALRYHGRYALQDGRLVAVQGYLSWQHPLRGELRASEFLPVADSTGLALTLSRWALRRMRQDLPQLRMLAGPGLRFSFGALRQHFSANALCEDVSSWIASGEIAAAELELRIAEKALANLASPSATLRAFSKQGVHVIIDEYGRGVTSLPKLARLPVAALQLDRAMVLSARSDAVAMKAVRAAVAIAAALELPAIAAGVDAAEQRDLLLAMGCAEGLGDCFGPSPLLLPQAPAGAAHAQSRRKSGAT